MPSRAPALLSVAQAAHALGVSESTVWRLIGRGRLASVRRGGRRLVRGPALDRGVVRTPADRLPPMGEDHPMFRLAGAGRGGGTVPGARDKHALLDR